MRRPSPVPSDPRHHAVRGPHSVGVTTIEWVDDARPDRRVPVDVWYPADAESAGAAEPADHPLSLPHAAVREPLAAPGRFPLVGFSHGNSGLRRQSTFLTTHLASWGVVVVSPDHMGNTFFEMVQVRDEDERIARHRSAREDRPRDLDAALDAAVLGDGPWARVDPERIGVIGHSFGGWTALKMPARRSGLRAVCGLAAASEPFVGRRAFAEGELPFEPELPVLLVAGIDDVLVDLDSSVRPLFERLRGPRALLGVEAADHFHFCDGIELLHGLHEKNPREKQPRPTHPYAEQLQEERMHRLLCGAVTSFLLHALAGEEPPLHPDALRALDPALVRLDAGS